MSSFEWALIQFSWCLYQKTKWRQIDRHTRKQQPCNCRGICWSGLNKAGNSKDCWPSAGTRTRTGKSLIEDQTLRKRKAPLTPWFWIFSLQNCYFKLLSLVLWYNSLRTLTLVLMLYQPKDAYQDFTSPRNLPSLMCRISFCSGP